MRLIWLYTIDDSTCDAVCDHHCVHHSTDGVPETRCVCDRGYYLALNGITCIGNYCCMNQIRRNSRSRLRAQCCNINVYCTLVLPAK